VNPRNTLEHEHVRRPGISHFDGKPLRALRVVAGRTPDDRAAPVVADPNGALPTEMGEQVEHVVNAVCERVIGMGVVAGGSAVAYPGQRSGNRGRQSIEAGGASYARAQASRG